MSGPVAGSAARSAGPAGSGTGSRAMLRFALRRDRVRVPVWAGSMGLLFGYAAVALDRLYPTQARRQDRAELVSSPAAIMMSGPGYGTEHYTLGAMLANEMALTTMIAVAIMSLLMVVRHTRAEEETGRGELIRAAVVGRHAPAVGAFAAMLVANLAVVVIVTAAQLAVGLEPVDSVALAVAIGAVGVVFGAVAVVTAQVTEHARAASGLALAALGGAFLLRAVGDVEQVHGSWLSWLSPIGWAQQIRAFVDLRWWPLLLCLVAVLALVGIAAALGARRDYGAGLVRPRAGRAAAAASLRGPLALAWRLQRGAVAAWAVGIAVMAAAVGTFVESIPQMLDEMGGPDSPIGKLIGDEDLVAGFIAVVTMYLVLAICAFAISSALRARTEEQSGRLEPLLATAVARSRWLLAQMLVTGGAGLALLVLSGLALGLGALSTGRSDPNLGEYLLAQLVYVPAIALVVGLVWALYGRWPRLAGLPWALVAWGFVVGLFGVLLDLPQWLRDVSPFEHTARVPAEPVEAAPLVAMVLVAVVLRVVAVATFRRRDLAP